MLKCISNEYNVSLIVFNPEGEYLEEIPENIREKLKFVPVTNMENVLKVALTENVFVRREGEPRPILEVATTMSYHSLEQ